MDYPEVVKVLTALGVAPTRLQRAGNWVNAPCVLAPWTHARGCDQHPSFGVTIDPTGESIFYCHACQRKGSLAYLVAKLEALTGANYGSVQRLVAQATWAAELPPWTEWQPPARGLGEPRPLAELAGLRSAQGHPYLRQRGITDQTVATLQLKFGIDDSGQRRILFPLFAPTGEWYGCSGRAIEPRARLKVKDDPGLPKGQLLLGAPLPLVQASSQVVLVEGLFDLARLIQYGWPAVAVLHSTVTAAQAQLLKSWGKTVILLLDNDAAGQQGAQRALGLLAGQVPVVQVKYPVGIKDPDQLSPAQLAAMVAEGEVY